MFRKALVIPVLLVSLTGLTACGGSGTDAGQSAAKMPAAAATESASPSASACPSSNTKAFAKTRFVADAGLAFGAFHRWIYKPYQAGTFKSGANGRVKAIAKAAAAGAFVINRLNAARKLVDASPLLCKTLKQPVTALSTALGGMVSKLKSGNLDTAQVNDVQKQIEDLRSKASDTGANITDKSGSIPGT